MLNLWAKVHLKWIKRSSSSWMGKPYALDKEEKVDKTWLGLCKKSSQEAQKETGLRYHGVARTREGITEKCKKESVGSWTVQEYMLMDTRNEERHHISHL